MRETNQSVSAKSPSLLRQAMTLNRKPFPWIKAFCAGVAAALPVLIGLWFGTFQYGLIAGMGGFTFLYVFNIPYAQRAKKLFFVVLGMALVSALGTPDQSNLARSYWVPLSCVAVMSGATIVATFHRAIQRGLGTIAGILIASFILAAHPSGYIIALFVLLLTFITELFIVKNYGLAALFFTPNALLMAESTSHGSFSFSYFASARVTDVLIGSAIGLIGVWLVGRRSASSRLPHLVTKTIRSRAHFLLLLFSDYGAELNVEESSEIKKMQTNIITLKTLYTTAAGEIPVNQNALDYYWPVLFSIERLGYLLESCSKAERRPILSEEKLAQILYVCETMANAAGRKQSPSIKSVPEIESFPSIQNEIIDLQKSLQMNSRKI